MDDAADPGDLLPQRPDDDLAPAPAEHLPVFVYGTLRHGGRFHDAYLAGRFEHAVPATLHGAVMWDNRGAYPYLALDPEGGPVVGELFSISPATFEAVLAGLDHLEGHVPGRSGNLYERRIVEVATDEGPQRAWVYVIDADAAPDLDEELPRVPDGDWLRRPGA